MAQTQVQIADQMIQQLRILDPSVSAAVGTPERKIIDTVAEALADTQIDISVLSNSLNLENKYGSDLNKFLATFNFARQSGINATGVVSLSRSEASNLDIRIPIGTQLSTASNLIFETTSDVILSAGETVVESPIRAQQVGDVYNVASNTIDTFVGTPVFGITGVTNTVPTVGGLNPESDAAVKVRFQNTVFRNLAGTSDQFLALAVAGAFTNKANVIGPISRYREYMQVPPVDDNSSYDVNPPVSGGSLESGNGNVGEYTTALSTIPYSNHVYDTVPSFLSLSDNAFLTEGADFAVNITDGARDKGDAYRLESAGTGPTVSASPNQPNITLYHVYEGTDDAVEAARPGDVVLFEHSYLSSASRNDFTNNINNCVDIYTNGSNPAPATTVIPKPSAGVNLFVNDSTNRLHFQNFRRAGDPDARPLLGNIFSTLYWNPLLTLPDTIQVDNYTYYNGIHYWPLVDVSDHEGTVRARTGIEWSADAKGRASGDPDGTFSGPRITDTSTLTSTSIEVANYTFDKNVIDLQGAIEASKQVTTDALVHKATTRYFKFNLNIMYTPGASISAVNDAIALSLKGWLGSMYFGNTIQLSDVLQQVHNVIGVDNVRWSRDVDSTLDCVIETDIDGDPRNGAVVDRVTSGNVSPNVVEIQQWYFTGTPSAGTFTVTYDTTTSSPLAYNATSGTIQTALRSITGDSSLTVTGSGTPTSPFRITWGPTNYGAKKLLVVSPTFTGGFAYNEDFTLRDNELPDLPTGSASGDTEPGLIIRLRSQSTWARG